VMVAGANLEAQTTIESNGRIEIAHRMYDVIQAAGHCRRTTPVGFARPPRR
jgi:hypothetical protein